MIIWINLQVSKKVISTCRILALCRWRNGQIRKKETMWSMSVRRREEKPFTWQKSLREAVT
jgi:tRNA and rRNA cytosine-C5-methylases